VYVVETPVDRIVRLGRAGETAGPVGLLVLPDLGRRRWLVLCLCWRAAPLSVRFENLVDLPQLAVERFPECRKIITVARFVLCRGGKSLGTLDA
jgi:hypothetical protein